MSTGNCPINNERPIKARFGHRASGATSTSWTETINGQEMHQIGTILLVNASAFPIDPYKPMKRVTATLLWNSDDGKPVCAVADNAVNLGNPTIAWL
jgi:hypothetical protein